MITKVETRAMLIHPPVDVKKWIEGKAAYHFASQNSEVIRILREKMDAEKAG